MKIAMIGLRGIPSKSGGIEVVVDNLAPLLVKLGAELTVYCRNPYCEEKVGSYKGVKLKYLPTLNTKHTEAISHSFLSTIHALFCDYDIVHYHAMGNALFSFIPRLFGKKTVVTLHGLDYEREKWGKIAKLYLRFCEKIITIFPNKVISVSNKIKEHYLEQFNKEIELIPNGVNIEKPRKLSGLTKFGIGKNKYILFISRIVQEKGLQYLIPAFKQLNTELKLLIVGDATHTDKYFDEIKDLAKDDKRIIFTGPLYGKDKIEAFSNARFFVLPSTIEGMPVVLLEAMSFGLCPLVSNIKENLEVIENGKYGFSFKTRSVDDLRKKLQYLIDNPSIAKSKGISCKKLVEKKYRWETIAKRMLEVYTEFEK